MKEQFKRTESLIGEEAVKKLAETRVIVFGIGGVGGFVCEALARAGVGTIDIVDKDEVDVTNINRQIIALHSTVGQPKVRVMKDRMLQINPEIECKAMEMFYLPETSGQIDFGNYDYVIDCVDNVTAKIEIITRAKSSGIKVISSMGTGNKLDPSAFKIADIEKTSVCPLARVVRKELRARGVRNVKVLYSTEEPVIRERTPASISFVPSAAGILIAGEVIREITGIGTRKGPDAQ